MTSETKERLGDRVDKVNQLPTRDAGRCILNRNKLTCGSH